MNTEADFLPLPPNMIARRNQLRVVGYELVRYTQCHAKAIASRYRHPVGDYEFAIHKIRFIEPLDGTVFIDPQAFYSSEQRVDDWVKYYWEKERETIGGGVKGWFSNPVSALLTVVVPPYGITMLGLGLLGIKAERKEQEKRERQLSSLKEIPKFWRP